MLVAKSLPFRFDVAAGVKRGIASLPIPTPTTLQEILVIFPIGTNNLLRYRFFDDMAARVPATGDVGGLDLFREVIDIAEFVGDNIAYVVPHHYAFTEPGHYIKMQAENGAPQLMVANAILLLQQQM